jgi:fructan beta-fructosidase
MVTKLFPCCLSLLWSVAVLAQGGLNPAAGPVATPQWRPLYHFTPDKNWTNDPNGLIYLNGVYHLYNQQNPFENKWGHMSWGHATSTDLLHWTHLPIAIPERIDKDTTWIFSGCAVWDKNNSSGFCHSGGCLVAIYTADQPNLKKESQFIAYSNDGGMTYTNYTHNPVIDLGKKDFRDPNVSWNNQLGKWLMIVALPTEHKVRFYASDNLKEWDLLSEFGNAGYTGANWECPSFMQLPVNGDSATRKWVLVVSAAGRVRGTFMQYFIGDFNGREFKNDNPPDTILTVDYGDCFYAAIPWNNLPEDRNLFIGWMVPGNRNTYPWKGQMSIPRDLGLIRTERGIRLLQQPSSLIRDNRKNFAARPLAEKKNLSITNGEVVIDQGKPPGGNSYWLEAELEPGSGTRAGFRIARKTDEAGKNVKATEIGYDAVHSQLYVDRSETEPGQTGKRKARQIVDVPWATNTIRLKILFDKSSLEVFVNNGEQVLTTYIYPDIDATGLSAFSTGGTTLIKSLVVWDLSGNRPE